MFEYEGRIYWTDEQAMEAVLKDNPYLNDDNMWDYFDSHVGEIDNIADVEYVPLP